MESNSLHSSYMYKTKPKADILASKYRATEEVSQCKCGSANLLEACVLCPLLYIRFWADDLSVQPIGHTD